MECSAGLLGHRQILRPGLPRSVRQTVALTQPCPSQRAAYCGQSPSQITSTSSGKHAHSGPQPLFRLLGNKRSESHVSRAASGYGGDDIEAKRKNRQPPTLVMRVLAAVFYLVPWMDIVMNGSEFHHKFPSSVILHLIPEPFLGIYYASQFAPLIIFFLLFLSVVKNFKLHHFTRFHCMQAIVLDIVTMLFTLVRQYFPAEVRWSYLMAVYDMFSYNACMCTILYCIFFALAGYYANIPYVSESTYMQVEEG